MSRASIAKLVFFLGGRDLEMITIRELLERHAVDKFCDKGLAWGARALDYQAEIEDALERKHRPVLIELAVDLSLPDDEIIVVDHHGRRAGSTQPTSLHQVFELLELSPKEWTRWHELVAANDLGHVRAMKAAGATYGEILEIRAADRRAQGVTEAEEREAERAVKQAEVSLNGSLTVVRIPTNRTSPVVDRLDSDLGGAGYDSLLVVSPDEVNVFGAGNMIMALQAKFEGGWYGGALPERGFWGGHFRGEGVLGFLREFLA